MRKKYLYLGPIHWNKEIFLYSDEVERQNLLLPSDWKIFSIFGVFYVQKLKTRIPTYTQIIFDSTSERIENFMEWV